MSTARRRRNLPFIPQFCVHQNSPHLARDRTPVTGELVEWLPLLTEPASPLSGGLQYVVRFAPLRPPAIADRLTSKSFMLSFRGCLSDLIYTKQQ